MFSPNDEQQLLMESVERFTGKYYPADRLESMGAEPLNQDIWQEMAEAGWFLLPFDEADGGLQPEGSLNGLADSVCLFEKLGEGLVVEPILASTFIAGGLIVAAPAGDLRTSLIEGILDGSSPVAAALHEPKARHDLRWCETRAEKSGDGWVINGHKSMALGGAAAAHFLVLARIDGQPGDGGAGLGAFALPRDAQGLAVTPYRLRDDHWAADVELTNAPATLLLGPGDADAALEATLDCARLLLAAESVGIMQRVSLATRSYLAERKQFGQPLAGFQVLQHRMVDMAVAVDQVRSLVYQAVTHHLNGDQEARRRSIHAAWRAASQQGMAVTKDAIQLHGGMGMSEELPMGRALRRMIAIRQSFPV